jgi:predicted MFS family arabinose efflux permease
MLFTGYGLGATLAGVLATGFSAMGGWRLAMTAVGVMCLAAAGLAWLWLREMQPDQKDDASQPEPAARPHPLQIVSRTYVIGTLMLWTLFISMLTISYCLVSWLPVLLVEVGRDESFAALSISIFSLGGIIAALGVGLLIDRLGALRVLISFLVIATIMLFAIGQVIASAPPGSLMIMLAVGGFFFLGAYGGVNVVLATFYPPDLRATGIGWTKSVGRVGTVLAPVLIGLGLSAGMAETTIMSLFAAPACLAVMSLAVIGITRWHGQRASPSA